MKIYCCRYLRAGAETPAFNRLLYYRHAIAKKNDILFADELATATVTQRSGRYGTVLYS
jgi:hypothetical protein